MKRMLRAGFAGFALTTALFAPFAAAVQPTEGTNDPATPPEYVLKRTELVCAITAIPGSAEEETGCLTTTRPAPARGPR